MKRPKKRAILSDAAKQQLKKYVTQLYGLWLIIAGAFMSCSLFSHSPYDVSWNVANDAELFNILGVTGAIVSDSAFQWFGVGAGLLPFALIIWGGQRLFRVAHKSLLMKILGLLGQYLTLSIFLSMLPSFVVWDLPYSPAGLFGALLPFQNSLPTFLKIIVALSSATLFLVLTFYLYSIKWVSAFRSLSNLKNSASKIKFPKPSLMKKALPQLDSARITEKKEPRVSVPLQVTPLGDPILSAPSQDFSFELSSEAVLEDPFLEEEEELEVSDEEPKEQMHAVKRQSLHKPLAFFDTPDGEEEYHLPPLALLSEVKATGKPKISTPALEALAAQLETILKEFGVRGEIVQIKPGPVVTLYELKPAAGIKTSRVIGLADDIARSMSALSARIAVIPGRNVIGIELPNADRETVLLREMLESAAYSDSQQSLPLILGKDIGGAPIIADLARMPHLLVAGTTGSGKSVSVNTMILSLLYRLSPEQCRFIMIDPKMLELSVYDDIPHLLTPVVTDPKKAVVALKWAVKEMENRYRLMSKLSVRNIDGYNTRVREAKSQGEILQRRVQTGFDPDTGKPVYENQSIDLEILPFIVVVVDEMADLMLVAGKEIESAVQRLAQMARAAGIHLIMATQRPSVDVITGTIKANFPTRISFQVTSKIDSRTILGEQGAEQLLGQGDMLYMAGGGRLLRVHGPFVSDKEVEKIVRFLKQQGDPSYIDSITTDDEAGTETGEGEEGDDDLYHQAVQIVLSEGKASTSFIQRKLKIGYNRAARIIDEMEQKQVITPANHVGKREIIGI